MVKTRGMCIAINSHLVSHVQVGLATPSCLLTKSADALKCITTPIAVTVLWHVLLLLYSKKKTKNVNITSSGKTLWYYRHIIIVK